MMVRIAARGFTLTAALARFIRSRVERRLGRQTQRRADVLITLSDVNGPRGGRDKRCRVLMALAGGRQLVAESVHGDMYAAIDDSLARAQRRLMRRTKRRQRARTRPSPLPAA